MGLTLACPWVTEVDRPLGTCKVPKSKEISSSGAEGFMGGEVGFMAANGLWLASSTSSGSIVLKNRTNSLAKSQEQRSRAASRVEIK